MKKPMSGTDLHIYTLTVKCQELNRKVVKLEADVRRWRNASKNHKQRASDIYKKWEEYDLEMIKRLDRIANPVKSFEEAQAAAQQIIDFIKTENSID